MLFKLYNERSVSLDDKLKTYLPEFSINEPTDSHDIVLRYGPHKGTCYLFVL